jgi:uracil-DNA glycosylase family protein
MVTRGSTGKSALEFLPPRITMASLREAALGCHGCSLYRNATQTVFGEGPRTAKIVLVGEVPGNDEDLAGHPFVGPAGRLLDESLEAAGIGRDESYVTNVVKHFKWEPQGKRRKHKKPSATEINACLPWLQQELTLIQPKVLVCLGATAAQALISRDFKVTRMRGQVVASSLSEQTVATIHPSSILRQRTSEDRRREMARFIEDLNVVAGLIHG